MKPLWCPILLCVLVGSSSVQADETTPEHQAGDNSLEIDKPARAQPASPAIDSQKSRNDLPGDKPLEIDKPGRAQPATPVVDAEASPDASTSGSRRTEGDFSLANTALHGTQDRWNRPNPLFSPSVGQINMTRGDWSGWPFDSSGASGDWLGARDSLQDNGIYVEGVYTSFMEYNFEGGSDTGFFGGGLGSASVTIDTEKLFAHPDGIFFINYQTWSWYNHAFDNTGSFDPTSNYTGSNGNFPDAASVNQISQLYYSQHLFDDLLNVAFGKQDANNIFSNIPGSGGFLYSGAGYTSTLNPFFTTFPQEATALTMIVNVTDDLVGSFGWFDGSYGGLNATRNSIGQPIYTPAPRPGGRGPATFFDNQGHWFLISEWAMNWQLGETQLPGAVSAGGWLQTGRSLTGGTLEDGPGVEDVPGAYLSLNQTLWAPNSTFASQGGGLIAFGQFGWSDPKKNPVQWSLMGGLSATGVIPGRPMDAMGLMGMWTAFSDNPGTWQSTTPAGGPGPAGGAESAIEAFYRVQLTPWLSMQPGVQFLGTPSGGDPAQLNDALVGYVMVELIF